MFLRGGLYAAFMLEVKTGLEVLDKDDDIVLAGHDTWNGHLADVSNITLVR